MSFSVLPSYKFKKEAKRLSKKYPSLKEELGELNNTLANTPETRTCTDSHALHFYIFEVLILFMNCQLFTGGKRVRIGRS